MKALMTLCSLVFSVSMAQASPLVTAVQQPGFVMNPQRLTLTIDNSGKITREVFDYKTQKTTVEKLGSLTKDTIKKISDTINAISPEAQLIDKQEGEPKCTDAPSSTVSAQKNGQALIIFRRASCHDFELDTYEGRELANLALSLLHL